jgi:hypothetical protein
MKIKIILAILCLTIPALLFSGCKVKDKGNGDDQSCTHNYVEGICGICGESDPNYVPDDNSDNKEEEKPEVEDNSKIPPINTDGETELPFVPAK